MLINVFDRVVVLQSHVKTKIFLSVKELIESASSSQEENNRILRSYLGYAFPGDNGSADSPQPAIKIIHDKLERDTHKILVWHVATSLCQIHLLKAENMGDDLYKLPRPLAEGDVWTHYNTATTLSNYCVHLVEEALLPDNGLVASKVLGAVCEEVRIGLRGCRTRRKMYDKLIQDEDDATNSEGQPDPDGSTILSVGTKLAVILMEKYSNRDDLWPNLAEFWARYLLYLSASTMAAKHRIHLQGRGELTTHLWVLLSHAGFLGEETIHGQHPLDPIDLAAA